MTDMDTMQQNTNDMEIELDDETETEGEGFHRRTAEQIDTSLPQATLILKDLNKSGLVANEDIHIIPYDTNIRTALQGRSDWKGYAIRYQDINGKILPHYRFRLLSDQTNRYRSLKNNGNQVYFPPKFMANFNIMQKKFIIIVEGEKKAALISKLGYPCAAFSGTDCYINKSILLPKEVIGKAEAHPQLKNMMVLKIEGSMELEANDGFAKYFSELIELARKNKSTIIICYDSDKDATEYEYKTEVQRSAARLAYEIKDRGLGIKQIKQMILPNVCGEKTGPDDFIMHPDGGPEKFKDHLNATLQKVVAFPNYPNIKEYIAKMLNKRSLNRKATQQLASAVMADLDRRGKRMYAPNEGQLYYFNGDNKQLMKVPVNDGIRESINETDFGRLLYREYDISSVADGKLVQWLGTVLPAEDPIEDVNPSRIIARPAENEDCVRYQINDGQFIKVTGDPNKPYEIHDNGQDSTLFTSGNQVNIDSEELRLALQRQFTKPLKPWWFDVLKEVKLKEQGHAAMAMGLLYYISPWLYRWRGTQLPVEMVCGESGSGKSTLVSLRLNILMGQASLRNAPSDLKDWYAQITQSGGMHVTDNLHFTDKQLAQRMSDELCRLVTEPSPTIEQRKYFTNAELIRFPINAIFSFTAIKQPFNNADLIQRAFILELDKVQAIKDLDAGEDKDFAFDSMWLQNQLKKHGGRVEWLAHHLHVLHKFFQLADKEWNWNYKAKYRLINLEQCMVLMAKILGIESDWIPDYLAKTTNNIIKDSDWVLQGLRGFADWMRTKHGADAHQKFFSSADISNWANANEDFEECSMLINTRTCGRYMQTAKYNIATIAGIVEAHKQGNRQLYHVTKGPPPK